LDPILTKESVDPLHASELLGENLLPDEKGIWKSFVHESGWSVHAGMILIKKGTLKHRIPCLGFVLEEETMMGRLMPEIVMPLINQFKSALTIKLGGKNPTCLLSNLKKADGFIDFPDGTRLHSKDCVSPDRPGRKLVILGDTCNSSSLVDIAQNADILVHEATNACLKVFLFLYY
jgi:ribonuclease Z